MADSRHEKRGRERGERGDIPACASGDDGETGNRDQGRLSFQWRGPGSAITNPRSASTKAGTQGRGQSGKENGLCDEADRECCGEGGGWGASSAAPINGTLRR